VLCSTRVEVEASSEEEAIEKAIEVYYGEIMYDLGHNTDYFDGLDVFVDEIM